MDKVTPSQEAFERYCHDSVVMRALEKLNGSLPLDLLKDAFMHGAKWGYTVGTDAVTRKTAPQDAP